MPKVTAKQHRLFVEVNNSVRDHLQFIGVAIVGTRDGAPHDIGSGTCIAIDGRHFVATADHVIRDFPDDELLLITELDGQTWTPGIRARGSEPRLDLAWIELVPGAEEHMSRNFIGLERVRPHCHDIGEDVAAVYGFPSRLVEHVPGSKRIDVQPLCFGTGTIDGSTVSTTYASDEDLYLGFPYDELSGSDGKPITDPIEAPGLSGGGIWALDINRKGIWTPESARLIGIQHSWLRWQWVRGTQIQHWLALVARDLPELAAAIASHNTSS